MIYKKIIAPSNHRLFFVGDIHGRYDILMRAIEKIGITKDDTIVSVGDLIDRGNQVKECLDFFLNNDNCHFIIGNHEELMINRQADMESWLMNGGVQTQEQLGESVDEYCQKILNKAPVLLEVEHGNKKYGVVHAGIPLDMKEISWQEAIKKATLNEDYVESLIWDRECIKAATDSRRVFVNAVSGIDYVIHGHTPIYHPMIEKNRIWIDTLYAANALTFAFMNDEQWDYFTIE